MIGYHGLREFTGSFLEQRAALWSGIAPEMMYSLLAAGGTFSHLHQYSRYVWLWLWCP